MQIGLFTNIDKDRGLSTTKMLAEKLMNLGAGVLLYGDASAMLNKPNAFELSEKPSVMVVLGGDGTVLNIADFCASNNIPILGLNLGRIGFLTGLELAEIDKLFDIISNNLYTTQRRSMLEIVHGKKKMLALNEVVVHRRPSSPIVRLIAEVDGEFVDEYNADGLIVATPTGSTAYSMSAGGPIIAPNAECFAITPICAHTLHARPIVLSGGSSVVIYSNKDNCDVVLDGIGIDVLEQGALLKIKKSKKMLSFITPNGYSFFSRLLTKLNKWGTTKQ